RKSSPPPPSAGIVAGSTTTMPRSPSLGAHLSLDSTMAWPRMNPSVTSEPHVFFVVSAWSCFTIAAAIARANARSRGVSGASRSPPTFLVPLLAFALALDQIQARLADDLGGRGQTLVR